MEEIEPLTLALPFFTAALVVLVSLLLARRVARVIEEQVGQLFAKMEEGLPRDLTHPEANSRHLVAVASWAADAASIVVTFGGFIASLIFLVRDESNGAAAAILLASLMPLFVASAYVLLATPSEYRTAVPTVFQLVVIASNLLVGVGVLIVA